MIKITHCNLLLIMIEYQSHIYYFSRILVKLLDIAAVECRLKNQLLNLLAVPCKCKKDENNNIQVELDNETNKCNKEQVDLGRVFRQHMRRCISQCTRSNNLHDKLAEIDDDKEDLDLERKTRINELKSETDVLKVEMRELREKYDM